jgi:hypothetical protein
MSSGGVIEVPPPESIRQTGVSVERSSCVEPSGIRTITRSIQQQELVSDGVPEVPPAWHAPPVGPPPPSYFSCCGSVSMTGKPRLQVQPACECSP